MRGQLLDPPQTGSIVAREYVPGLRQTDYLACFQRVSARRKKETNDRKASGSPYPTAPVPMVIRSTRTEESFWNCASALFRCDGSMVPSTRLKRIPFSWNSLLTRSRLCFQKENMILVSYVISSERTPMRPRDYLLSSE
jgi:hypothetical protein